MVTGKPRWYKEEGKIGITILSLKEEAMKKGLLLTGVLVAAIIMVLSGAVMAADLNWVGCGITKKAFMSEMAAAYEKKTGVKINLQGGGATKGIRDVAASKADIGGSCRHVLPVDEEKNAKLEHVAWDAIVVITNPANPVTDISSDDLKGVFTGKITNWRQLGGPDMAIKVATRKGKNSGVGRMVRELLFKDPDFTFFPGAIEMKSSGPVEKFVEKERSAIGFTGVSSAKKRKVNMISINGKAPTTENIASGDYILYRPLYLVTDRNPSPAVKQFISFAKSDEGQKIIADEGTVNLKAGSKLWQPYRKAMKDVRAAAGSY